MVVVRFYVQCLAKQVSKQRARGCQSIAQARSILLPPTPQWNIRLAEILFPLYHHARHTNTKFRGERRHARSLQQYREQLQSI